MDFENPTKNKKEEEIVEESSQEKKLQQEENEKENVEEEKVESLEEKGETLDETREEYIEKSAQLRNIETEFEPLTSSDENSLVEKIDEEMNILKDKYQDIQKEYILTKIDEQYAGEATPENIENLTREMNISEFTKLDEQKTEAEAQEFQKKYGEVGAKTFEFMKKQKEKFFESYKKLSSAKKILISASIIGTSAVAASPPGIPDRGLTSASIYSVYNKNKEEMFKTDSNNTSENTELASILSENDSDIADVIEDAQKVIENTKKDQFDFLSNNSNQSEFEIDKSNDTSKHLESYNPNKIGIGISSGKENNLWQEPKVDVFESGKKDVFEKITMKDLIKRVTKENPGFEDSMKQAIDFAIDDPYVMDALKSVFGKEDLAFLDKQSALDSSKDIKLYMQELVTKKAYEEIFKEAFEGVNFSDLKDLGHELFDETNQTTLKEEDIGKIIAKTTLIIADFLAGERAINFDFGTENSNLDIGISKDGVTALLKFEKKF